MSFRLKPDYEISKKKYDAFWDREIIDRPPACLSFTVEKPQDIPQKQYESHWERWMDIDFRAETDAMSLENRVYYGDALPIIWPNMGPGIFSAWCGCSYEFGETTAWTYPYVADWEKDSEKAVFSEKNPLFTATVEYTKKLLELGKDNFIDGINLLSGKVKLPMPMSNAFL